MRGRNIFICGVVAFDLNSAYSASHLEIVKSYYTDQQQEKAFKFFLEALQVAPVHNEYCVTEEEHLLYGKALEIYLGSKGGHSQEGSQQILSRYVPILEKHLDYSQLAYIVALAHANQNNFTRFFEVFYSAFQKHPHHYLAYKTKAILWIKLFERELPGEIKESARAQIMKHLEIAVEMYPQDTSLYRLKILYAALSEKPKVVGESLNKIIHADIVIPRVELEFYLQQALSLNDREITRRFINKASEWYHFSRLIMAAREQFNKDIHND